jgi:transcriptional repressor NrdR
MKCPFCSHLENRVLDSRLSKEGDMTRRRRECLQCGKRFTTYERIEEILPWVVKKDGRREPFDRLKIASGMKRACEKRPISMEQLDQIIGEIERYYQDRGDREIESQEIGQCVMAKLKELDEVAYVRFASVYREFKDISEFVNELKNLKEDEAKEERLQN